MHEKSKDARGLDESFPHDFMLTTQKVNFDVIYSVDFRSRDVDNVFQFPRLVLVFFLTGIFPLFNQRIQQHESTTRSALDDNDPPHIISQEDTPTMSQSEEDALRSAVLSALSSSASASPIPSGLPSSGSASSSGFSSSETPKISTPSGSSSGRLEASR